MPANSADSASTRNHPTAGSRMTAIALEGVPAAVPVVAFLVFAQPDDANGDTFVPQTTAILDSQGQKAVPGVCMACHGGSYTLATHTVSDARFLPFDTTPF